MKERGLEALDCHPRPSQLDREPALVHHLMAASGRDQNEVTELLFTKEDLEWRFSKLFESDCMVLPVDELLEVSPKVLRDLGCIAALRHEPERGASLRIYHQILTRRRTKIFVTRRICSPSA